MISESAVTLPPRLKAIEGSGSDKQGTSWVLAENPRSNTSTGLPEKYSVASIFNSDKLVWKIWRVQSSEIILALEILKHEF